jgi:hypothetical protein
MKKLIYTNLVILIYLLSMTTECYSCDQDPFVQFQIQSGGIYLNIGDSITFISTSYDPDDGNNAGAGIVEWIWNVNNTPTAYGESSFSKTFDYAGIYTITLFVQDNDNPYTLFGPSEEITVYVSEVALPFCWYCNSYWHWDYEHIYVPVGEPFFVIANSNPNSGDPDYFSYFRRFSPSWDISGPSNPSYSLAFSGYSYGYGYDLIYFYEGITVPGEYTLHAQAGEDDYGVDIDIVAVDFDVSPAPSDNGTKVMISTEHDDNYHTEQQWVDGKIRITVTANPTISSIPVYFRTYDPDDKSSYETNTNWDDNNHTGYKKGGLDVVVGYTSIYNSIVTYGSGHVYEVGVYTNEYGIAEVDLNITNQYAGDNYRVYVSTQPNPGPYNDDACSDLLVAWKRIYLERDNMYTKGATITSITSPDGDALDNDIISVDNSTDFSVNDNITFFMPNGTTVNGQVKAILSTTSIQVTDLNIQFPTYSGIMIQGQTATYSAPTDYLEMTYGTNPDGYDNNNGGAFVEFVDMGSGGESIPKYTIFPGADDPMVFSWCWFNNRSSSSNCVQLVAANKYYNPSTGGCSQSATHLSVIFVGNHTGVNKDKILKNSVVHELGHQFDVSGAHVDSNNPYPNHLGSGHDDCLMTYHSDITDEESEFCTDCIAEVRGKDDPI